MAPKRKSKEEPTETKLINISNLKVYNQSKEECMNPYIQRRLKEIQELTKGVIPFKSIARHDYAHYGEIEIKGYPCIIDACCGFVNITNLFGRAHLSFKNWLFAKAERHAVIQLFELVAYNNKIPKGGGMFLSITNIPEEALPFSKTINRRIAGSYCPYVLADDLVDLIDGRKEEENKKIGRVYIMTSKDKKSKKIYKIGHSYNIEKRLKQFQTADPDLRIDCAYEFRDSKKVEKIVHERLKDSRVSKGCEFFHIEDIRDVLKIFEECKDM